ncbi:phosphatidylglycerophosphatase [Natronococcus pandeyae]|uniref:Phosphatidylglycerophosphatase n=1 Tax=Natronococcus pandeyae TaxID=2055836 RepID=A0A8J8TN53_9EURY|nr:phosphatase PAP2 family protein [Natronococcus pandeyae]TYL35933.1 phosphatidylglycerophosphatase [Natronococcus pandeyae]
MLTEVLTQLVVVVTIALLLSIGLFVGRERLVETTAAWRSRFRASAPAIGVLLVVLLLNRVVRWRGDQISSAVGGIHMTETFYRFEGEFILLFQSIATDELTMYFSAIYIYGYTFMLVFPVVAYFALSDSRIFRRLLTAYSLNYLLGLSLYLLVIAYGPRNVMPEVLEVTMLYDNSPQYQHLTREVNRPTNVFPSLHTSLAAIVAMFAYTTRSSYPKWFPVAVVLAISVAISTMYLGIHWAIDVVAGLALAAICVVLSDHLVGRWSLTELYESARHRLEERRRNGE